VISFSAFALAPVFTSAVDNATTIKGGATVTITTVSADADTPADTPLKLYVCKAADATSAGCGAGGTYCSDVASLTNSTCNFTSESDSAAHTWHAYLFDSNSAAVEAASNNPLSDSYTTDSTGPTMTPSSPGNSTYTNDNTPALAGTSNETIASCAVQIATDSGFASIVPGYDGASGTASTTSCTYTTPATLADGTYYWRMKGTDSLTNAGSYGSAYTLTIDTSACAAVTNLDAATGTSSGQINLSWGAASCTGAAVSKYRVYRQAVSFDNAGKGTAIYDNITGLSQIDTPTPVQTYYYAVLSVDSAGNESTISNIDSADPAASGSSLNITINSPSHPNESAWYGDNSADFNWGAATGATFYYKFNSTSDSTVTTSDKDDQTTSTTVNGLSKTDGIWYFHIVACTSNTNCGAIDHYTVRIDTAPPEKVTNATASSTNNGVVTIRWTGSADRPLTGNNSGIDHYDIYRSRESGFQLSTNKRIGNSDTTSFTDDDSALVDNTTYFYKIAPVDAAGNTGEAVQTQVTVKKSGTTSTNCNVETEFSHKDFVPAEKFDLIITSDGDMVGPTLMIRLPVAGKVTPIDQKIEDRKITTTIELGEKNKAEKPEINLTFKDSSGKSCTAGIIPSIDSIKPVIEWVEPQDNDEIEISTAKLTVSATDDKNTVKSVKFYYKTGSTYTELQGTETSEGNETTLEGIEISNPSSELELKAVATDVAGNSSEATLTLKVKGGETLYKKATYTVSTLKVSGMLEKAGLDKSLIDEARKNISAGSVKRELQITETDGSFNAFINISITNSTDEDKEYKVIEFIPKSFAKNASQVESDSKFTVVQADPVIEFESVVVEAGKTISLIYYLKDSLTQEQADSFISNKVIQDFAAPPALLNPDSEVKVTGGGAIDVGWIGIAFAAIVIIIIVAAIVIGGGLLLYRKLRGGKVGRGRLGKGGPMESISGELHKWFEEKELEERYEKKKSGKFSSK
jgi:hypothetical protein